MAGLVPSQMREAHAIRALGLSVSLSEYEDLPAVVRDDLLMCAECDVDRARAAARAAEGARRG